MDLKIVLAQINAYSDKLLHGRSPSLWRFGGHALHFDAVEVGPSTPSRMRAKRESGRTPVAGGRLWLAPAKPVLRILDKANPLAKLAAMR
jgi:hypothetical protein